LFSAALTRAISTDNNGTDDSSGVHEPHEGLDALCNSIDATYFCGALGFVVTCCRQRPLKAASFPVFAHTIFQ
jgi:hypothetical protein